ncbi:MAG: 2Fe-2S iron-sulfur cluster-binding protein [Eubacterium sp.]|nr:2Fe-2S iron-sulfur cluster-binding protein [Eubacterium sp.]
MAKAPNLHSISPLRFQKLKKIREEEIRKAAAAPLPKVFPVNALSAALHPDRQYGIITAVKSWDANCKSFTFSPDTSRGTTQFAWFQAGAYICVFLAFDGMTLTRPYSISSSPRETLNGGTCTITVKRVPGGLASNFMLDHWKTGDQVTLSGPLGEFVYLPIRDAGTVIGLAGGSGITPFHAFAKSIVEEDEDFNLILFYGSRTEKDILFKEDFDLYQKASDKIKVVHVLSDEDKEGYEHGFITADLIARYAPEQYSVFMCGPAGMYKFLDQELGKLHLEQKWIRHELQGEVHNASAQPDYPANHAKVPDTVQITVRICGNVQTLQASSSDTVLQSLEKNGIAAPAHCRSGECGWCRSRLVSGEVFCPKQMEHRRAADADYHYFHPCCSFPMSDLEIEIAPEKG